MRQLTDEKVDAHFVKTLISDKANSTDLQSVRQEYSQAIYQSQQKVSHQELATFREEFSAQIEDCQKELLLKCSIKDLLGLLDQKASLQDVNQALKAVENEVARCATESKIQEMFEDHNLVQEALCAENCLGRWIWKSSSLQGASQVPWEVQSINTCPENFLWEKNKTAVVMAAPGLY